MDFYLSRVCRIFLGLTLIPSKGFLRAGASVKVDFFFRPLDESIQSSPLLFEPDCAQPIKIKFNGGGGYARISLSKYKRFDFGHCMIDKETESFLPICNEGLALSD